LAAVEERLRERQDAPERTKSRRVEVDELERAFTVANAAVKEAEKNKLHWERLRSHGLISEVWPRNPHTMLAWRSSGAITRSCA
jgi:hypothetical protein